MCLPICTNRQMTTSDLANLTNGGGNNNQRGNNQVGQGRGNRDSQREIGSGGNVNPPLFSPQLSHDDGGGVKEDVVRMADHHD